MSGTCPNISTNMKGKLLHLIHSTTEKDTRGLFWILEIICTLFKCSSFRNLLSNSHFLMDPRASMQADLGPYDPEDPVVAKNNSFKCHGFGGKVCPLLMINTILLRNSSGFATGLS